MIELLNMRQQKKQTFSSILLIFLIIVVLCILGFILDVNNFIDIWIYGGILSIIWGLSALLKKKIIIPIGIGSLEILTDKDAKTAGCSFVILGLVLICLSYFHIIL